MRLPKFIKKIIGCTDSESSRYALGGVKCEFNGKQSTCVATDGRKLIAVDYDDDTGGESFDAVVDGKTLSKAVTAVTQGKASWARITHDSGAVRVQGYASVDTPNGMSAAAMIVDGRFPRYKDVFGIYDDDITEYVCVKLDPDLLSELLAVCSAAQNATNKGVYMWVNRARAVTSAVYLHMHGVDGELVRAAIMPLAPDDGTTGARCCKAYPKPGERTLASDDLKPEPTEEEPVVSGGPPECLDDDVIAAAVTAEPEPVGVGSWIPPVS